MELPNSDMTNLSSNISSQRHTRMSESGNFYDSIKDSYEKFTFLLKPLLEGILDSQDIKYLSVSSRLKDKASYVQKSMKEKYRKPTEQIVDVIGCRIILYKNSDVNKVRKIIEENFDCNIDHFSDKHDDLGVERVGYLSVHFVCQLPEERVRLMEFRRFGGVKFEIQVRTVLQHAWADINHGSVYKSQSSLPKDILRRFSLLAGLLELADREFDAIDLAIDDYISQIVDKVEEGNLSIEINIESLSRYIDSVEIINQLRRDESDKDGQIVDEIRRFGIDEIQNLDQIMKKYSAQSLKNKASDTVRGLLRDVMMMDDLERYLNSAVAGAWGQVDVPTLRMLASKYDIENIYNVFSNADFQLNEDDLLHEFKEISIDQFREILEAG